MPSVGGGLNFLAARRGWRWLRVVGRVGRLAAFCASKLAMVPLVPGIIWSLPSLRWPRGLWVGCAASQAYSEYSFARAWIGRSATAAAAARHVCFLMGFLRNPANVQQTSSKCIQNTYVLMLDVCWIV